MRRQVGEKYRSAFKPLRVDGPDSKHQNSEHGGAEAGSPLSLFRYSWISDYPFHGGFGSPTDTPLILVETSSSCGYGSTK